MFHTSKTGAVDVIRVEVPLNAETSEQLAGALSSAMEGGRPMTVVDLSGMTLIDSKGLEELLNHHEQFAAKGGELKLAAASPLCQDVLRITGLLDQIEHFDDAKDAVASFLK